MRKLLYAIIVILLLFVLCYKAKTDIDNVFRVKELNKVNVQQVEACSEYLKSNPDGVCD